MEKPLVKIYNKDIYRVNQQHNNEYRRILIAYNRVVAFELTNGTSEKIIANTYYIVNDRSTLKAFKDFINCQSEPLNKLLKNDSIEWIKDINHFETIFKNW